MLSSVLMASPPPSHFLINVIPLSSSCSLSLLPFLSCCASNHPLPLLSSVVFSQVCCHPGLWAAAAPVPQPLWLPPQVASDSTGPAAFQRGQPYHRGPAEKSPAAHGVCVCNYLEYKYTHAYSASFGFTLKVQWLIKMYYVLRTCWMTGSHNDQGFRSWTRQAQSWSPSSST